MTSSRSSLSAVFTVSWRPKTAEAELGQNTVEGEHRWEPTAAAAVHLT